MATVRTQQGDTVDLVALRHYGDTTMVEAILAANPGLSAHGAKLPHGLAITLPPAKPRTRPATITLWT
ncbi:tail protein X (plasmid) [Azospirillum sp. HJ39]|uniref:tail protein X n=1 Tax=Azospirillum sp. HJ39 TaxID=3159496 RepID=UPI003558DCD0